MVTFLTIGNSIRGKSILLVFSNRLQLEIKELKPFDRIFIAMEERDTP